VEHQNRDAHGQEADVGLRIGSRRVEANFRFACQPPTIITWAEEHFYDLPLIRPSDLTEALVEQIIVKSLIAVYGFCGMVSRWKGASALAKVVPWTKAELLKPNLAVS
jgi:hypothetical protein